MSTPKRERLRCAVYCRKSVEEGLEQEYNSLDAQRDAGEAYISSQKANGWVCLKTHYDDGGFSGGNLNRPALKRLMEDCEAGKIDVIVVYKIDRLSRSICDFTELSRKFDAWDVDFVSVTQEINTRTSSGRMMLNILMTFAQFEREILSERVRDKIAATRLKGKWTGGTVPIGYRVENKHLIPVPEEVPLVRRIFRRYIEIQSTKQIALELNEDGLRQRNSGKEWTIHHIYRILNNVLYIGKVSYKGQIADGEHERIIDDETWERVHEFLDGNNPCPDRARRLETMIALKGILRCGHCDSAMSPIFTRKGERKYYYYKCGKDSKRGASTCPIKQIPAGDIEPLVFRQLFRVLSAPEFLAQLSRMTGTPADRIADFFGGGILDGMRQGEKRRLAELMLSSAVLYPDRLELEIRTAGIQSMTEGAMHDRHNH